MIFPEPGRKEAWTLEGRKGRSLVFDIETDGLLPTLTKCWLIVAIDTDTLETWVFSDHDSEALPFSEGMKYLRSAKTLIGHHILGFDLVALARLDNNRWFHGQEFRDTLVMSKTLNYHRFGNGFKHSLKDWGEFLGRSKPEHEDWTQYSQEMKHRCIEDTRINVLAYKWLKAESKDAIHKNRLARTGLDAEHGLAEFCARSYVKGWKMNVGLMKSTMKRLQDRMEYIRSEIEPHLKNVVKLVDAEPKKAVFIKNGNYNAHTARWFGVDPSASQEPWQPVAGEFQRIEVKAAEIGNPESVKKFLTEKGWEPDEWNWKKDGRQFIKMSSKLTTSSLEKVEHYGPLVDEYFTIRARFSILRTWIENLRGDRLVGDLFTIGTPTGRATHQIIANIPSAPSFFGS